MPSGHIPLSNNSLGMNTRLYWWTSDDPSNNRTTVNVNFDAWRNSSTTFGSGTIYITIDGTTYARSAYWSIGTGLVVLGTASKTISHSASGSKSITISASGGIPDTSWTSTSGSQTVGLTNYSRPPSKPGTPSFSQLTPTSVKVSWGAPTSINWGIDDYDIDWATNSSFSGASDGNPGNNRTFTITGLKPATKYYVRTRAHNSDGWGSFSTTASFTTPSAAYVGQGGIYPAADGVYVGKGGQYVLSETVKVGDAGQYITAG